MARRHKAFLDVLASGDAGEAEALFRSVILIKAYQNMGRPIPSSVTGYITRDVRADGTIIRLS